MTFTFWQDIKSQPLYIHTEHYHEYKKFNQSPLNYLVCMWKLTIFFAFSTEVPKTELLEIFLMYPLSTVTIKEAQL
jgi:hypothetical protein